MFWSHQVCPTSGFGAFAPGFWPPLAVAPWAPRMDRERIQGGGQAGPEGASHAHDSNPSSRNPHTVGCGGPAFLGVRLAPMRAGIDLGGTKIQAVVIDDEGAVKGQERLPTPTKGGPADVAAAMATSVRTAAEQAGVETGDLAGVGIGSPGVIDAAESCRALATCPTGRARSLGEALTEALGARVKIDNDVNVATDAELALGAGRPYRSMLEGLLGDRRGRRHRVARQALARTWGGRRDRPRLRGDGWGALPMRRRGCVEAYAGRKALEERARHRHEEATRRSSSR